MMVNYKHYEMLRFAQHDGMRTLSMTARVHNDTVHRANVIKIIIPAK